MGHHNEHGGTQRTAPWWPLRCSVSSVVRSIRNLIDGKHASAETNFGAGGYMALARWTGAIDIFDLVSGFCLFGCLTLLRRASETRKPW